MNQLNMRKKFYDSVIRAVLTVLALGLLWKVVMYLPMLQNLWVQEIGMQGYEIARVIIALIIVGILLRFASVLETQLPKVVVRFPQGGFLAASVAHIIAIFIAYNSLQPMALYLLKGENNWIFQVFFLLLVCIPLYRGGRAFYKGINDVSDFFTSSIESSPHTESIKCSKCGTENETTTKFCNECGTKLIDTPIKSRMITCPQCGAENKFGAKHCSDCGTNLT